MIRRVFLGDLGAGPGRYLRDLLVLVGLGAVGALIAIGVHQLRLRAGHRMQALPALGSPIRQPLAALGVDASAMSTPYGVVVFLDKEWAQSIPLLAGALDSLSNRGFTVYVAAPAAPSAQEPPTGGARFVMERTAASRRDLGFLPNESGFIVFQRAGALAWQAAKMRGAQFLRRGLLKLRPPSPQADIKAAPLSPWMASAPQLAEFPFDRLMQKAPRVRIDLDRLPRRTLRVVRTVGDSEFPSPGEPVFARPAGVVVDGNGRVFVPDPEQHQVFVLSPEGDLVRAIGGPGRGPGEMGSPMGVGIGAGGKVIVAEGCCRLHEFTAELDYVRSLTWPVEVLPLGGKAFVVIGALALVRLPPLPPARTNVMHLFALDGPEPLPVGSFLPYAKPQRSFREASLQQSAVSSRNIVVLGTDANRYVALARAAEAEIIVWDLILGLARRYELRGHSVEIKPRGDAPGPPYAVVRVVKDIAFDSDRRVYALVRRYGLLRMPLGAPEGAALCTWSGAPEIEAQLGYYYGLAAWERRVYLVAPGLAQLAICTCE